MEFLEQLQKLIDEYQGGYNQTYGKLTFSQIDDMEELEITDMILLEEDISMLKFIRDLYKVYLFSKEKKQ